MGSAAVYHFAKRGVRVLGLDQFHPPHNFGSSHGQTRIIREAYFEHPAYVPLVQQAYRFWDELENLSGERLFQPTGGLIFGSESGPLFSGALRSAREHYLPHEVLSAKELHRRHPGMHPPSNALAVWEPRAGILSPERCVAAHLRLAREHGASLNLDEIVTAWEPLASGVHVTTSKRQYLAR